MWTKELSAMDWEKIELYMKAGASSKRIAESFNVSVEDLMQKFKERYGENYKTINRSFNRIGELLIEATQFQKALAGNPKLLIWLGKIRCNQRENEVLSTLAPLQDSIDKDHMIMQLQYKIEQLKKQL